ncbi:uncharacterized protein LOC133283852 [Gastrolobium bilobum]|uniref:uncharacterized protein LOC133283852 n=1 Tax=Gastrolobium bilobum TaxID=150636 RepID=UPI002AB02211|nr:uncharacterized protein LOC133283852 [Gastrolobium bilobum]
MAILSKNKLGFIDGTIAPPDITDPLFLPWQRCNTMVLSWLHRSINSSIEKSILWMDRASEVWIDLKNRFSHFDIFRLSDIQEDIYKLQQGELNVTNYFTELKILWDEYDNLRPFPKCNCAIPCNCGLLELIRTHRNQDQTIRFLKGLNEQYAHVRSQIMMIDPLPHVSKAFSLVVQKKGQFQPIILGESSLTSHTFFNASHARKPFIPEKGKSRPTAQGYAPTNRSPKICTHCGKMHHTIDTCYQLHGFPPGYKTDARPRNAVNLVQQDVNSDNSVSVPDDDMKLGISLSQNQYQRLMSLLQTTQLQSEPAEEPFHSTRSVTTSALNSMTSPDVNHLPGTNHIRWILDTGATDHI